MSEKYEVVSLFYLAVQLRQNTKALHANATWEAEEPLGPLQRQRCKQPRVWMLIGGIAGVLVEGMIVAGGRASSSNVIVLFIAIELIVRGWTLVALALAVRSAGPEAPPQPA